MSREPDFASDLWASAARQLGLTAHEHDAQSWFEGTVPFATLRSSVAGEVPLADAGTQHWLHGRYEGHELILRWYAGGVSVTLALDPPLRLGVKPAAQGLTGYDPALVRALFDTPSGREFSALRPANVVDAMGGGRYDAGFTDDFMEGFVPNVNSSGIVTEGVDRTVALTALLLAARRETPKAAWERELEHAFTVAATELGVALDLPRMTLTGTIERVSVRAEVAIDAKGLHTVVTATIDPPLGLELRVARERPLATLYALIGAGDITTGDAEFDRLFFVDGKPTDAVRAALGADVRKHLVELHAQGAAVEVSDDKVELTAAYEPGDTEGVARRLAAASAIVRGLRGAPAAAPYRG